MHASDHLSGPPHDWHKNCFLRKGYVRELIVLEVLSKCGKLVFQHTLYSYTFTQVRHYTSNYIHPLRTLYVKRSTFSQDYLRSGMVILSICASLSHGTLFICLYTLPGKRQSVVFYRSKRVFLDSKIVSDLHSREIVA